MSVRTRYMQDQGWFMLYGFLAMRSIAYVDASGPEVAESIRSDIRSFCDDAARPTTYVIPAHLNIDGEDDELDLSAYLVDEESVS